MAEPLHELDHLFFQRWENEFERTSHPLARALHGFVALEELRACSATADYLYSGSTFQLIDDAKWVSTSRTLSAGGEQGHGVVRLYDVVAALLLRVNRPDRSANTRSSHEIEERLAEALGELRPTAALKEAEKAKDSMSAEVADAWVLDPDLVDTCALSAYLVEQKGSAHAPVVDLEDFVIAILLIPLGRKLVFETFLEPYSSSSITSLSRLLRPIVEKRFPPDTIWDEIFREIDETEHEITKEAVTEVRVPDYVADRPIEKLHDDVLNFREDARAVAEIVCQRNPGPPLAIGLFGDWGSGKSSFMNLLHHEIDQLAAQAHAHQSSNPFITRVDHIFFNAWQYNDVQLWPVLAENTFAQLRAGGAEGLSRQLSDEVLRELTKQVETWQDTADGLALDLMQTQHQETEKQDRLLKAANDRDDKINEAREEAIKAIGNHIANSDQRSASVKDQKATAADLVDAPEVTAGGTLRDVVKAVRIAWELRKDRWLLLVGIALTLVFAGVAWFTTHALFGLAVPVLPVLMWLQRAALPLVAALRTYRVKQEQAEQQFRRAQRDTSLELARLQRDIRQKENEIRRQLSRAAQFKGTSPAQVLEFFLSESAAVRSLQNEVGVVSRVRRAFQQLNAVIKSHDGTNGTPQRIVFYIDDLDRCRAEQVVRVLEAVHLLLAFDRFVVVVGVDTRWLETSLMSFYDEQLRANRDAANGGDLRSDPRATVRDYVEKIFQVPIQIPRLTTGEDGTFARLVDVLSPVTAPERKPDGGGDEFFARLRQLSPIQPLEIVMREPERFREAVARAQLSTDEVNLLKQLGSLAGRSPRAVKRLLNLYRLLRATRISTRLNAFLEGDGTSSRWPDYPGAQLCLAVEVGSPAEQIHRFREAVIVAAGVPGTTLSQLFLQPAKTDDPWTAVITAFFEALSPAQRPEEVHALLRTIVNLFGDTPDRLQVLRDIVVETSRFSFSPLADQPWRLASGVPSSHAGIA
jgi:KAP family P-loop domain